MIYLDNCATTKPREEVVEAMTIALREEYGNPSSLHRMGMEMENKIESIRSDIAIFLNVSSEEIYFTSGGTESNNIAIQSIVKSKSKFGKKIITSIVEHSSVENVYKQYKGSEFDVVFLKCDGYGNVDLEELENEIDDETILVSFVHVNNELGSINDIKAISEIVKKKNPKTHLHVDGVQAFGKIDIDLKELNVDSYSISGHKIHGPKGVGLLYLKKGININPIVFGGNQESGIRSGTENTTSIIGLGKAVECLRVLLDDEIEHKSNLRKHLVNRIENEISDIRINTDLNNSASAITNISFLNTRGEVILHYLENDDIYISTASACCSNTKKPSSVLAKLGYDNTITEGSIRVCTSYEISIKDIDYFVDRLKLAVEEIRKITMR